MSDTNSPTLEAQVSAVLSDLEAGVADFASARETMMTLIAEREREARLSERKTVALDNYRGQTFSDATNWKGKFEKFMEGNERRIANLTQSAEEEK